MFNDLEVKFTDDSGRTIIYKFGEYYRIKYNNSVEYKQVRLNIDDITKLKNNIITLLKGI